MTKRTILAAGCLLLAAVPCSAQEKVVIGGSGALMNELPQLVQTYQARYPSDSESTLRGREGFKALDNRGSFSLNGCGGDSPLSLFPGIRRRDDGRAAGRGQALPGIHLRPGEREASRAERSGRRAI